MGTKQDGCRRHPVTVIYDQSCASEPSEGEPPVVGPCSMLRNEVPVSGSGAGEGLAQASEIADVQSCTGMDGSIHLKFMHSLRPDKQDITHRQFIA